MMDNTAAKKIIILGMIRYADDLINCCRRRGRRSGSDSDGILEAVVPFYKSLSLSLSLTSIIYRSQYLCFVANEYLT
jgi:hypothetical protein